MNPTKRNLTLLPAAFGTLLLAACSSQSPELEEGLARQQRPVPELPGPQREAAAVVPLRTAATVDEVTVTGARTTAAGAQNAVMVSRDP